jgi:predicted membrane-bound spermidine synthase
MHKSEKLAWPLAMMALSGAAALIYEIIWMRMLSRAFGVTVYATASLVALYMAGLALGAAGGARLRWRGSWLRLYAWLEAAAGAAALLGTWWMIKLPSAVGALSAERPLSAAFRLLLAAPALLPATCLLGATLPALTRHCGSAGRLYAANTLGAMAGLTAASFWMIGQFGESTTIAWAAACNAAAALLAWTLSRGPASATAQAPAASSAAPGRYGLVLTTFMISGFCALGYEILWSRQLSLLLGNSTYAFALLLIVYLGGVGLGSAIFSGQEQDPLEAFGMILTALGCAAVLSLVSYRFIGLAIDSPDFLYSPLRDFGDFPLLLGQAVVFVLPLSLMLGLLFPAAVKACSQGSHDGATVGKLYAWNTAGGILGSLWAGFFGITWLGTHKSFMLLAGLQIAAGLAVLAAAPTKPRRWATAGAFLALSAAGLFYAWRDPGLEILGRRLSRQGVTKMDVLFHDESAAATITGIAHAEARRLFINGIETSGNGFPGKWMALLPNLFIAEPKTSLVICFGAGNTFSAASKLGGTVDAVELIGDVPRRMPLFQPDADQHLGRPDRNIFIEDGRNYLLRSRRDYDTIIVDATPPLYSAGTVNLYTKEFLDLARKRLKPEGIFTLWLPTLSFESDYWQILRSASEVFPHIAVWSRPRWEGFLVLGSARPIAAAPGVLERRIKQRAKAVRDLCPAKLDSRYVRSGFRFSEQELRDFLQKVPAVTDDLPSVEFPLGRFWRGEPLQETTDFLMRARNGGVRL